MQIRAATLKDTREIADVHIRARQAAYRGIYPDDFLDGLSLDEHEDLWRERLTEPGVSTFVAVEGGQLAGHVRCGPCLAGPDGAGEVLQIHVAPEHWRKAYGSALLSTALATLLDSGYTTNVLWVYEANDAARRFYERHNWWPDGARLLARFDIPQVRYRHTASV